MRASSSLSMSILAIPATVVNATALQLSIHNPPHPADRRDSSAFADPRDGGGRWLDLVPDSGGQGEPLNVVIAATSDAAVLVEQQNDGGLINYFQSIGFANECLGQHEGSHQQANLGDGNGYLNESAVIRWDYGDAVLGTCKESIEGGNHFRYWIQNGDKANTGAVFLAASYEMPATESHNVIKNGYNLGRDWLVGNATAQSSTIPTLNVTNQTSYSGQTTMNGYVYQTSVQYTSGLLANSSDQVNHRDTVALSGLPAVDGLVAVMEVRILQKPASTSTSGAPARWTARTLTSLPCLLLLALTVAASSL
ncbi:unnamed protein product [Peniophora sp. CBMAI 1063]|nr:unnamed protein product [Peniophora sp. CBMAI 1063]